MACFGITAQIGNVNWNQTQNQNNYRYCIYNGDIRGRAAQEPMGHGTFGGKDAILKMVVDMDQGTLTFFVDNQQVNSCNISKSDKYFAYVSLEVLEIP